MHGVLKRRFEASLRRCQGRRRRAERELHGVLKTRGGSGDEPRVGGSEHLAMTRGGRARILTSIEAFGVLGGHGVLGRRAAPAAPCVSPSAELAVMQPSGDMTPRPKASVLTASFTTDVRGARRAQGSRDAGQAPSAPARRACSDLTFASIRPSDTAKKRRAPTMHGAHPCPTPSQCRAKSRSGSGGVGRASSRACSMGCATANAKGLGDFLGMTRGGLPHHEAQG